METRFQDIFRCEWTLKANGKILLFSWTLLLHNEPFKEKEDVQGDKILKKLYWGTIFSLETSSRHQKMGCGNTCSTNGASCDDWVGGFRLFYSEWSFELGIIQIEIHISKTRLWIIQQSIKNGIKLHWRGWSRTKYNRNEFFSLDAQIRIQSRFFVYLNTKILSKM